MNAKKRIGQLHLLFRANKFYMPGNKTPIKKSLVIDMSINQKRVLAQYIKRSYSYYRQCKSYVQPVKLYLPFVKLYISLVEVYMPQV
jgi:hypothetical protein